jgi:CRP/FNR family cyclic AMP-dependent transcriptional regulator
MPTDPSYLQKFSCFRDLSENQRNTIAQLATAVCFPEGYVLCEEGKPGEHLYLLANGQVEVLYSIGEDAPMRVDLISGEDIIGCCTLVPPYIYTSTVRSLTETEMLEIDADALRNLMREDCPLGFVIQRQVMSILMDRITSFRLG